MASQEEKVEVQQGDDNAEFTGAWDDLKAEESGQPADAAGRQDDKPDGDPENGDEAGQGEATAGQPEAGTTPGTDADEASRGEITDDVLAGADPTVKALIEQEREERKKAQNLARSNGARLAQALNRIEALTKSGGAEGDEELSPERKEKMDAVRRDYPEVAEPLLEELATLRDQIGKLTKGEVARAESELVEALDGNFQSLLDLHPDLPTIVADPAYAQWLEGQPPSIKRIVAENQQSVISPADAALVFDKFKSETGFGKPAQPSEAEKTAAQLRQDQLEAGRSATGMKGQPGVRSDAAGQPESFDAAWDDLKRKERARGANRN